MVMHAELAALAVAILALAAESLHACANQATGPAGLWARAEAGGLGSDGACASRDSSPVSLTWGLITLLELPPKVHVAETIPDNKRRAFLDRAGCFAEHAIKEPARTPIEPDETSRSDDNFYRESDRALPSFRRCLLQRLEAGVRRHQGSRSRAKHLRRLTDALRFTAPTRLIFFRDRRSREESATVAAEEHASAHALRRRHGPCHRHAQAARVRGGRLIVGVGDPRKARSSTAGCPARHLDTPSDCRAPGGRLPRWEYQADRHRHAECDDCHSSQDRV